MDDLTVARLRDVGFSLYEAKLYVALLRGGAQNGNEVAKKAGVPTSKVYAALDKLATEGWVDSLKDGTASRFSAVDPAEVVGRLRQRYNAPLDYLAKALPKATAPRSSDPFLTVVGDTAIMAAAQAIIDAAGVDIHISVWSADLPRIAPALMAAHQRGIDVFGMLYGEDPLPPGAWMRHHYREIVANRVGGRLIALVADHGEGLIARFPSDGAASAVRSRNPVFALIVREYLHHDNMLQRAQSVIGFERWDDWWQGNPSVRAEILGRSLGHPADPRRKPEPRRGRQRGKPG